MAQSRRLGNWDACARVTRSCALEVLIAFAVALDSVWSTETDHGLKAQIVFIMAALSNRMPLARNPMRMAPELAEGPLRRANPELLMTSVPPIDHISVRHIQGLFSGRIPLRTSAISSWPSSAAHLQCLHCGGVCNAGPPVPAARQYDSMTDTYWVYGPFCRPCCALGHICEHDTTSRQMAPSMELLRRFFGMVRVHVAPPRQAHVRFGGPLADGDFYGHTGYATLTTVQPPFVTFANYVLGVHAETSESKQAVSALLPQSAGALVNLERPSMRVTPLAERRPTGKAPLILEFLATLTSAADVKDADEAVQLKGSSKKRARPNESAAAEPINFLKQYVKKP